MARIRSVHPGLWTDETFVGLTRDARLLLIGLWSECDDRGVFEWKPLQIKMRLCAGDDVSVAEIGEWLAELTASEVAKKYSLDGKSYGAVRNFCRWQRPKKPNYTHPMPDEFRHYVGFDATSSEPKRDEGVSNSEPGILSDQHGSEPSTDEPATVPNQFPTGGEKSPQREEIKEEGGGEEREEESKIPPYPPRGPRSMKADPECAAFYAAYPRHDAPDDAAKAWRQVTAAGANPADIMAGLARYKFSDEPKYIKLPASWLRAGCWKSEALPPLAERWEDPSRATPSNPTGRLVTTMTGGF